MTGLSVFAYGTLITGALDPAVDRLLARHCRERRPARVPGRLYDLGAYPGAVPAPASGYFIHGEVLRLSADRAALRLLDDYEGHDPHNPRMSLFRRSRARVEPLDGGRRVSALVYWYQGPLARARLLPEGDWAARR